MLPFSSLRTRFTNFSLGHILSSKANILKGISGGTYFSFLKIHCITFLSMYEKQSILLKHKNQSPSEVCVTDMLGSS